MSTRPSNEEFIDWAKNDQHKSKIQIYLSAYPDLNSIKDSVSFNRIFIVIIMFTF